MNIEEPLVLIRVGHCNYTNTLQMFFQPYSIPTMENYDETLDYLDQMPDLLEEEELQIDPTAGKKPKRTRTTRQTTSTQLANLAKGRKKLAEKKATQRTQKSKQNQYVDYMLEDGGGKHDEPKLTKRSYKKEHDYYDRRDDEYTDYSDSGSDYDDDEESDDVYEIRPRGKRGSSTSSRSMKAPPKGRGSSTTSRSRSRGGVSMKEANRIDKIESILLSLVQAQKKAKKAKVVRNTVIQIPKSVPADYTGNQSLNKLIKLF
jgi:hypothetical protein